MGRGLLVSGVALGVLALVWGFLLLGVFALLAATGDATFFLAVPLVALGAGAISIAGGVVGRTRLALGSILILVAGVAGLIVPARALLINLAVGTTLTDLLTAYLAVGWWSVAMIGLGGGVLLWGARRNAVKGAAPGP